MPVVAAALVPSALVRKLNKSHALSVETNTMTLMYGKNNLQEEKIIKSVPAITTVMAQEKRPSN